MRNRFGAILVVVMLAACASPVDGQLAAFPGLQRQIEAWYDARAFEQGATCNQPRMILTDARIIQDSGGQLIVDARYAYDSINGGNSGGMRCRGFGERRFTAVSTPAGVTVTGMTGEQR